MNFSQLLLPTLKEIPADAETVSHQLMLRAGLIRKVSAGIYSWLPLGLKVLRKVEQIIREEMNNIGAQEVLLPAIHPAELWQESGRWDFYGKELLRIKDRHERDFCFGPTHEEIITDLFRKEVKSYKQLPLCLYQIQTKFRDEIRPRFGIMRAREFLMKDAYSFHIDKASLQKTYEAMYQAYCRIFDRLGLEFRAVEADTGSIGGSASHEFQVLAQAGEDIIAVSDQSSYAANIELAQALPQSTRRPPEFEMEKIATPGIETIAAISEFLKIPAEKQVKTLIVKGNQCPAVALILRGDHELNPVKAEKLVEIAKPLTFLDKQDIAQHIGAEAGSLGPVKLKIPMIVDNDAALLSDFSCGANETGFHFIHVNWERDVNIPKTADLRRVVEGDLSPDGQGQLKLVRGIEVGHIFQLGTKYSKALKATVLNAEGEPSIVEMGCYGIGVSRIIAAAIEQNHDERGILWSKTMAPFDLVLIPLQISNSSVMEVTQKLYQAMKSAGYDILLDDRDERPGVKFADADLIGIPKRIVISEKSLNQHCVELKMRNEKDPQLIHLDQIVKYCVERKS